MTHIAARRATGIALAAGLALGASSAVAQEGQMVVVLDFGVVPFGQINAQGEKEGFSIDLAGALAERLGRPGAEVMDVEFSGMFAERFEKLGFTDYTGDNFGLAFRRP